MSSGTPTRTFHTSLNIGTSRAARCVISWMNRTARYSAVVATGSDRPQPATASPPERVSFEAWWMLFVLFLLYVVSLFDRLVLTMLEGLSHKDAARFAFLLATPIIGAAALLKLPELAGSEDLDLGWRLQLLGHRTVLAPAAQTYCRQSVAFPKERL